MVGKSVLRGATAWLLMLGFAGSPAVAEDAEQTRFRSPTASVDALLEVLRAGDSESLSRIFGPNSDAVLSSGDEVADRESRRLFLEHADSRLILDRESDDRVLLSIGEDDWPFPIPLVRGESGWYFDTAAGAEELVNRRIGRNELYAIAVVNAFVNAQYEYYARAPLGEAMRQYAQRIASSEGQRDGLYWPVADEEQESPLGPMVAKAALEGYGAETSEGAQPYHGYLFRLLTGQGSNAPGGERSYVEGGAMTGGFAFVAYPVDYGVSGIMTFVVNQRGIVYQKDLGEETEGVAEAMERFDPDSSWEPVPL